MSETYPTKPQFFNLRVHRTFWYFFPRDLTFFLTVNWKFWGFGKKVSNSVFGNALKLWKTAFLFFVDFSILFSRNLSGFCWNLGKIIPAAFSKQLNTCAEEQFAIFSKEFDFSFFFFDQKTSKLWAKLHRQSYHFFTFVCRGHLVYHFSKYYVFFWMWD